MRLTTWRAVSDEPDLLGVFLGVEPRLGGLTLGGTRLTLGFDESRRR
jgi:hypothetical protein